MRKPYFKKARLTWYVNDANGKPIKLGKGITKEQAWEAWKKLDSEAPAPTKPREVAEPVAQPTPQVLLLASLIEDYLEWVSRNRASTSHASYERAIRPLKERFGDLPALETRPFHLDKIVQAKTDPKAVQAEAKKAGKKLRTWSQTTCWQLYKTTIAMFNWAVEMRIIPESPLGKIKEKPQCAIRQDWIDQAEFDRLIAACDDELLINLLAVLWDTGARPFEIFQAEARHLDRQARCLRFARANGDRVKAKRGKQNATRTVFLSQRAFEICCELAAQRPTGPLFVNNVGNPWTANLVSARLRVLRERTGIGVGADKRQVTLYTLRHSFCTRLILKGENIRVIQELMAHSDLSMISAVYAHLNKENDHLNAALDRLAG